MPLLLELLGDALLPALLSPTGVAPLPLLLTTSPWLLGPGALVLAYGAAKAGTALCNEGRNMVFAKAGAAQHTGHVTPYRADLCVLT